jgi:hypothetical protein
LIAVPSYEPQAPGSIKIKLGAAKIGRQADAQPFDRCLLVCPQNKEPLLPGRSPQGSQGPSFPRCEIALRNVYGLRQITHLLDIDADRVISSHCEQAVVAAV